MPPHDAPRSINPQTMVSLTLAFALAGAGALYGEQAQRLRSVEEELRAVRAELKEIRTALVAQGAHQYVVPNAPRSR
jgi:hypothetical protein